MTNHDDCNRDDCRHFPEHCPGFDSCSEKGRKEWINRFHSELLDSTGISFFECSQGRIRLDYFCGPYWRDLARSLGVDTDKDVFFVEVPVFHYEKGLFPEEPWPEEGIPPDILECAMCGGGVDLRTASLARMTPEGEAVDAESEREDAKWRLICQKCAKKLPDDYKVGA